MHVRQANDLLVQSQFMHSATILEKHLTDIYASEPNIYCYSTQC